MPVNANDFLWRRGALCRQRRLKHLNECLQTSCGSETLLLFLIEGEEHERLFLVTNDEESESFQMAEGSTAKKKKKKEKEKKSHVLEKTKQKNI